MVRINDSKCVAREQVPIILKRIEIIKSEAIIIKKGAEKNGLQKITKR